MNSIHPDKVDHGNMDRPGEDRPHNALVQAAADGDLQTLQRLRREHPDLDLNVADDQGRTALAAAVDHGRLSMVEQLVQSGARIDVLVGGLSAIHRAAVSGHLAMVQTLLALGADVNQRSESGETPLMRAIEAGNFDVASFLLQQPGIQVNATSHVGETALLKAVRAGNRSLVRDLVNAGAPADAREGHEESAFVCALRLKDKAMMKVLLELGADINQPVSPYSGNTALMEAVVDGHLNKARWLLAQGADLRRENPGGWTALRLAAIDAKGEKMLRLFLEHGVDHEDTARALDHAIQRRSPQVSVLLEHIDFRGVSEDLQMQVLTSVVRQRNSETYELLLRRGADPRVFLNRVDALVPPLDKADALCLDTLRMAAWCGDVEMLQALSRQGFDLLTPLNELGENALHGAVDRGHLGMVDFLLGGDRAAEWVNAQNHLGFGPLHFVNRGRLDMAGLLLRHGANVNQGGVTKLTPLIWAVSREDEPMAGLLLDHGALCTPDAVHLRNPLHWAVVEGGSLDLVTRLRGKVDINARDGAQRTPLMLAVEESRLDLVRYLLDEGAEINLRDHLGNTALHLAGGFEQKGIAQLLKARGADETLRNNAGVAAERAGGRTAVGSPQPEQLLSRARQRDPSEADLVQVMRRQGDGVPEVGPDVVGVDWRHEDLCELPPGLHERGLREDDWLNITDGTGITEQYRVVRRDEDGERVPQQRADPSSPSLLLRRQG
ncbi:MAG: ankyrin repeat domain-containing protein [Hydrogenophaga sp.]|uniref:ankyrin repeat domain-containing protein n=1 Tax=Hydrogenophaga sp. TaxID=1904254 RepID=UPI0025BF9940|nr:ankyrin repeat domain-containing protein [Hydrogenophaga sp.]MBU7572384.1 ankyrin repeat domain-containing protein [Hydrogenophaga sp.]